jgi:galactose mutarotase-like enzyme
MVTIENQSVKAVINPKGAELTGLFNKSTALEYMWSGDSAFWPKHSPVLFPIVGTLKKNTYFHKGKSYTLPRHGFTRERQFVVEETGADYATFLLRDDEESYKVFPFSFEFRIKYTVTENALATAYDVKNTGKEDLYFSLGAHPAFKVPLADGLNYTDYYLSFNKKENAPRWLISKEGLIDTASEPLLENSDKLPLKKELFLRDAVVIKHLSSSIITLKSDRSPHGLQMDFPGFPFMGIWAAKNADFVCIEPWCGIADGVNASQQLAEKEGINRLQPDEEFSRTWTVRVF